MTGREILLIITSIGAVQSILIGLYFLASGSKKSDSGRLLGALLIALGVRVAKSTLYIFSDDVSMIVINIGFAAHAASAPLFMLYILHFKQNKKLHILQFAHLLPALFICLLSTELTLGNFWYRWGYSALLYYSLSYIVIGNLIYIRRRQSYSNKELKWLTGLAVGVSLFLIAYFSNYILGLTSYSLAPTIYSFVIYLISYLVLQNYATQDQSTTGTEKKYKYLNVSEAQAREYHEIITKTLSDSRPYLDPDFNLTRLSELTTIPSYTLSYVFSNHLKTKFTDFINAYRIKEAQSKLADPTNAHFKISTLAYDCGFNSLSSFNAAFKKFTKQTPSQFRDSKVQ